MLIPKDYLAILEEANRANANGEDAKALWIDLIPFKTTTLAIKALLLQVKLPYFEVGMKPSWQANFVISRKKYGYSQDIISFCNQITTTIKIIDGIESMAGGADSIFVQFEAMQ